MKKVTLLIVANNFPWQSWADKINEIKKFFGQKFDLSITLVQTKFTDIPFVPYQNQDHYYGVLDSWYDTYITSQAKGYDIVMLVMNTAQWKLPNYARGWRTDNDQGPVELQVSADENESIYQNGVLKFGTFQHFAEHEILHAMFMITKEEDTTHVWDYARNNLSGALGDLTFPNLNTVDTTTLIQKITSPLTKPPMDNILLNKMCLAIQSREGYFAPGQNPSYPKGTPAYNNCNPGNLRYANQIGSIGQKNGFAIFPNYQTGFDALKRQILLVAKGKSKVYPRPCTIQQFFNIYSPISDGNDPVSYALEVSNKMGVTPSFSLSGLLV